VVNRPEPTLFQRRIGFVAKPSRLNDVESHPQPWLADVLAKIARYAADSARAATSS
jgi:hypothetical protein